MMRFLFLMLFSLLTTYTEAYLIKDIQDKGRVLILDDGSEWDVKYFGGAWKLVGFGWKEQKKISHWTNEDEIQIEYPKSGNFTDFVLVMHNLSRKERTFATLKEAPSSNFFSTSLWVADYNRDKHQVKLNDGTVWFNTNVDMYGAFLNHKSNAKMNWKIGDRLTLVRGEGHSNKDTYFLWNHETNQMPIVERKIN